MKLINIIFSLVVLTFSAFFIHAQHVEDPSLVAKGAKVYSENCARCHNARPAEEYSKKEWSVVIPHMRAKAHMTGKEALAVEAFLASTLTADVRNAGKYEETKVNNKSGAELITQFGCQGCHQIKGEGGKLGPTLDGVVSNKGEEFVLKKLTDPKFNNAASAMPKYPMNKKDMIAIVDFLKK